MATSASLLLPVQQAERIQIVDILRGFLLLRPRRMAVALADVSQTPADEKDGLT